MKTLELFNCVEAKKGGEYKILPEYGVIVEPSASHALNEIKKFLEQKKLSGNQLNSTFHKSWKVVQESSREELWLHQILHYITTYGTGFQSTFNYFPNEELDVPQVETTFLVVRGLTKEEIVQKALDLLKSGVALKQETIFDILEVLSQYKYQFTGDEEIKNKEALMIICRESNIVPKNPVEFVRYLVYLATGKTLLIKNKDVYRSIESMNGDQKYFVNRAFLNANEEQLAEVFNRFKPIFLTFKKVLRGESAKAINRISRLSKTKHKPMPFNILNNIGSCSLKDLRLQRDNLRNANFFQLARCLQYLQQSANSENKIYQIRNGKSFVQERPTTGVDVDIKIMFLKDIIREKYPLNGLKVYIPEGVHYALPTSEKLFVGNVPMGTKLVSKDPIALGVYWKNSWGARDLDLSGVSTVKVGWNARFDHNKNVTYSGDITNAPNGATEYIRVHKAEEDQLILNNVFSGEAVGSGFNIVVGRGSSIDKQYMMDPNNVWFTASTKSVQRQSVVGMIVSEDDKNAAIVVNLGCGGNQVSGAGKHTMVMRKALAEKWKNCFYLEELLEHCGAELVDNEEDCDVNLSPSKLEKDTILSLFKENE